MMPDERAKWLEKRKGSIGSSDAPVIYLGEYYGKTWADLWRGKMGIAPPIDDNADMRRGRRQEPVAALLFEEVTCQRLETAPLSVPHPDYPWMTASIDRVIQGDGTPVEIKCPRFSTFLRWRRDGIPPGPLVQGQHQLAVIGHKRMLYFVFCAEIDEYLIVPVDRDNDIIKTLIARERDFWTLVETGTPPREDLQIDHDMAYHGEIVVNTSPEWAQTIEEYRMADGVATEADAMVEDCKARLQQMMGEIQAMSGSGARVYYRWQDGKNTFDKTALQAAHPEINIGKFEKKGKPFRVFKSYLNVKGS